MDISSKSAKEVKEELKEVLDNIQKYHFSGKVQSIKDILQKDTRKSIQSIYKSLENKIKKLEDEIKRVRSMYEFDDSYGKDKIIAGIDEVGRGPLAGPIVSAAVILDRNILKDQDLLLGIKDSKKLSLAERERLYDIIIEKALDYSISVIDNKVIDARGIAWCNNEIFKRDVLSLKIEPNFILCDGYKIREFHIESEAVIKGDNKSASIACASILAKVYRDRMMKEYDKEYPQYDFLNNVGYGTKVHIEALKKYGYCDIHRKSFIKNLIKPD